MSCFLLAQVGAVLFQAIGVIAVAVVLALIARGLMRWQESNNRDASVFDESDRRQAQHDSDDSSRGFFDPVPGVSAAADETDMSSQPGRPSDPGPLVTVASYVEAEQAHLARIHLEQHDIPVFVADAGVVGMDWMYSNAVGGVKVQVPERDAQRAAELLHAPADEPAAPTSEEVADVPVSRETAATDEATPDEPRCTRCGSAEVYRVPWRRGLFFLLYLILGLALPVASKRYQCDHCGASYRRLPGRDANGGAIGD